MAAMPEPHSKMATTPAPHRKMATTAEPCQITAVAKISPRDFFWGGGGGGGAWRPWRTVTAMEAVHELTVCPVTATEVHAPPALPWSLAPPWPPAPP